jgi:hypothetical protein
MQHVRFTVVPRKRKSPDQCHPDAIDVRRPQALDQDGLGSSKEGD